MRHPVGIRDLDTVPCHIRSTAIAVPERSQYVNNAEVTAVGTYGATTSRHERLQLIAVNNRYRNNRVGRARTKQTAGRRAASQTQWQHDPLPRAAPGGGGGLRGVEGTRRSYASFS